MNRFSLENVPTLPLQALLALANARISPTCFDTFFIYAANIGVGPDSIVHADTLAPYQKNMIVRSVLIEMRKEYDIVFI